METVNHECYVSLEVAKLLKKAGFDWECNGVFISEDDTQYAFIKMDAACDNNNSKYNPYNISAPTLDVAQRWLREVKNYEIFVVVKFLADKEYIARVETNISGYSTDIYKFYEEAQEAGIKKALEMILKK